MVVKIPLFSRLSKARALKRTLDEKAEEIKQLKKQIKEVNTEDNSGTAESMPNTPIRDAVNVLKEIDITPRDERIQKLLPYTTTLNIVKNAPSKIRQKLFSPIHCKSQKVKRRVLSYEFQLLPECVFFPFKVK